MPRVHNTRTLYKESRVESFWELVEFALLALAIVIPIRMFVAQPFIVNGSSMDPTFMNGQYLIVDEISYRFNDPGRGDVIIFRYPKDPSKFFIKRVIGLPGEMITIHKYEVFINGDELDEPFIAYDSSGELEVELREDEYFVMGDNRAASSDSRVWGPLPEKFIVGKALIRLIPFRKAGFYPGDYEFMLDKDLSGSTEVTTRSVQVEK